MPFCRPRTRVALLLASAFAAGCVTTPPPAEGPTADSAREPQLTATDGEPTDTPVAAADGMDHGAMNGGQDHDMDGGDPDYMPLFEGVLGPHTRAISTSSAEAQQYFTQGMQLLYAFTPDDAVKAFRMAQRHDPECAMCYFGEAWALGPYLNGPMIATDAPMAHAAIQTAVELQNGATAVERALIGAMATRYEPEHDADRRRELDQVYSDAMHDVWEAYPNDYEVGTLYGESLMLLQPRRGLWDIENPEVQHIHAVLEGVLARKIDHPGACHLYIHSTEPTQEPGKAEACADHLGDAIPGASHINHMPSHTYNRIGRWDDAVRANTQAWHSDLKAEFGEGFAIYPSHNVHMLLFAASMAGQGGAAAQAARDYTRIVDGGQFYETLVAVRFGRFDEVFRVQDEPEPATFKGLWEFSRGYAHLKMGDTDAAQASLDRVREIIAGADENEGFRGHPIERLVGVVAGILEGEMAYMAGRTQEAVQHFETAIELEDALRYDEPEPLNFAARHWLGALLVETGDHARAETVYREALDDHPNNGWSLFGLEQALRAQGKTREADTVRRDFEDAWARADVWIRGSRF